MGWLYGWSRRADLIEHLVKDYQNNATAGVYGNTSKYVLPENSDCAIKVHTLKKCFKGSPFRGTLWAVKEHTVFNKSDGVVVYRELFIACYLLQCSNYGGTHEWGYKGMSEGDGPCEVNCPLSYLDMVPQYDNEHAGPWREKVRAFHAARKLPEGLQVGDTVTLKDGCTPGGNYRIFIMRPLRIQHLETNMVYKAKKSQIKEIVHKVGTDMVAHG